MCRLMTTVLGFWEAAKKTLTTSPVKRNRLGTKVCALANATEGLQKTWERYLNRIQFWLWSILADRSCNRVAVAAASCASVPSFVTT